MREEELHTQALLQEGGEGNPIEIMDRIIIVLSLHITLSHISYGAILGATFQSHLHARS